MSATVKERSASAFARLFAQATPFLGFLELEAIAEAIRLGHDQVTPVHLLMAALVLEEEMEAGGLRPSPRYVQANDAVLGPWGLTRQAAVGLAVAAPQVGDIASPQSRRSWRTSPKNPPWSVAAARAAERARELGGLGSRVRPGLAHLVLAVLSDEDDSARQLIERLSVDPSAVRGSIESRLGVDDMHRK